MKRILNVVPFLLLGSLSYGQLVNQGGTITIQPGATLVVESDFTNNTVGANTGMITVKGELNVKGDYINNATIVTDPGSLVIFSGDSNSDVLTGGTIFENVKMAKDDATNGTITLMDAMNIKTNLDFDPATGANINKMVLEGFDLIFTDAAATITDADAANYIDADAAGMVEKPYAGAGSFEFPVGGDAYSPISVDASGTFGPAATLRVNTVSAKHPNAPTEADDFINRYWNVNQSDITGYSADLTATYDETDNTDIMGASQADGAVGMAIADWNFAGSGNGTNEISGTVTDMDSDFTGFNFFGKANVKVFLQGAYSGGSMSTTLSSHASFPTSTPYDVAPWNAPTEALPGALPANITDWILVEARDGSNNTVSQTSALLRNDGQIVGLDGGALILKDADASSVIAVRHRNHLGVRTASPVNLTLSTPALFDMSQDTALFTDGAIANDKMKDESGTKVLWSGDLNSDEKLQYNGGGLNDRVTLLFLVGLTTPNTPTTQGYYNEDSDLDGIARYNGGGLNDRVKLLFNVGLTTPNTPIFGHL